MNPIAATPIRHTIKVTILAAGLSIATLVVSNSDGTGPRTILVGSAPRSTENVLFIGNSFTYVGYNGDDGLTGVPAIFEMLAAARGHHPTVRMAAIGSATLRTHYQNASKAMDDIAAGPWDYVVLQGQSQEAAGSAGAQGFLYYGDRLSAAVKKASPTAKLLAYETWAFLPADSVYPGKYANPETMLAQIQFNYQKLCNHDGDTMVRVGEAFQACRVSHPDVPLIGSDFRHPTTRGAYLAALMFYCAIYHEDPHGLPSVNGVTADDAGALQNIAAGVAYVSA